MKILKMTTKIEMELAMPLGDTSQDDIDELQSEEGQKTLLQEARKDAEQQANAAGGKLISFELKSEVIDI